MDGMLQPASAATIVKYDARKMEVTHSVFVAENPLIVGEGYRLTFGSRNFFVSGVTTPLERGDLYAIDVREFNDG